MKITVIILLTAALLSGRCVYAEDESIRDRVICSTLKSMVKGYLSVTDINKLKASSVEKMVNVEERNFRVVYYKIFLVISELPARYKAKYGLDEYMSRSQFIRRVLSLDKEKLYAMVDDFPDNIIVKHFNEFIARRKLEIGKDNLAGLVKSFWNKIRSVVE